ncbi:glutathione S-transferase family protein [Benzoatithermus flavus]|uniref:Glutathione S-transferase C-terminal domain-containing protein n=1 Tax=Benzoatithermus flavus TaxID=3108223 RepID=A0ABU8XRN7_9PROT
MITLYYSPNACSMAPHIALEEAGASFEARPVYLRKGQHKEPWYLAINPNGQVPTLVVDGVPLTQNVAILTWIGRAHPEAGLLPSFASPMEEAQFLSLLAWLASSVHPAFGQQFAAPRLIDDATERERFVARARAASEANLARIDRMLAGKEYAFGRFSVADAYLFVFLHWAKNAFAYDLSPYPNYVAHRERLLARPAVQRVLAREQEAMAASDAG